MVSWNFSKLSRATFSFFFALTTPLALAMESRVIHGTEADIHDYPFIVALTTMRDDGSLYPFCGGTLVKDKTVLTAAHCLVGDFNVDDVIVVSGAASITQMSEASQSEVDYFIRHADYNSETFENDIAAVFLKDTLPGAIPIAIDYYPVEDNTDAKVAGWGVVQVEPEVLTSNLLEGDLTVVSQSSCNDVTAHNGKVYSGMICALGETGQDACYGDSGGPLMASDSTQFVQIGIVSWGNGCGNPQYPGVYTRLSAYKDWLQPVVESVSSKSGGGVMALGLILLFFIMWGFRRYDFKVFCRDFFQLNSRSN